LIEVAGQVSVAHV